MGEEEVFSRTTVKACYEYICTQTFDRFAVTLLPVAFQVRVTALRMIRTWRSITRNVVEGGTDHSQYGYCD